MDSLRWLLVPVFCLVLCSHGATHAADPADAALQTAIENSAQRFSEAFEKRDAGAIAELFTPEGEFIDLSGLVFHGRAAIAAEYAASFQALPAGKLTFNLLSVRPVAAGLIIEEGIASFSPREGESVTRTHYTATHLQQPDQSWKLASVRELEAAPQSPHEKLQELAWLVGAWHEDVNGTQIATEWKWAEGGNYLVSQFTIQVSPDRRLSGTHRIGWDPVRRSFRSWVFDVGGSFAEGSWSQNPDGSWSIALNGTSRDGDQSSTLMTYSADGANAIHVTQERVQRGGELLPPLSHRIVRQPPGPQAPVKPGTAR